MKRIISVLVAALCVCTLSAGELKYVFYFIGDGMGWGHVNAAQYYNRIVLEKEEPLLMMQFPVAGSLMTYSASAPVTDSAAAGTALATGHKTRNYMIGVAPDSITPYTSVAEQLKAQGWGVGLVSSLTADDATPAAFYAHQPDRGMTYEICLDALSSGFDFLGGAALKGAKKHSDVMQRLKNAGYTVVRDTKAPALAKADKVVLLSPQDWSDISYTIDSIPGAMKLPEMTRAALEHMVRVSPDRFFMMVEGGNIDHAAHANDGGTVIKEIVAFQDAVDVAYKFYLEHPDETLIIVTADHDTGGMTLNRKADLKIADYQRMSKDAMSDYFKELIKDNKPVSWKEMKKFLTEKLGFWETVKVNGDQHKALKEKFNKTFVARDSKDEEGLYNSFSEFVTEVYNVMNYRLGTAFTTRSHSANPVPLFAIGKGAYKFTGMLDNTDVAPRILEVTK